GERWNLASFPETPLLATDGNSERNWEAPCGSVGRKSPYAGNNLTTVTDANQLYKISKKYVKTITSEEL
ncbi:hypothetical protein DRO59_01695, partial [Candidatus Bathyarchaeota archaeon]